MNKNNIPPRTFYGIDTKTNDIRCVSVYADGKLSMATQNNPIAISKNISGTDYISEIATVCNLLSVVEIPFALEDSDFEKKKLAELQEIAQKRKGQNNGP